MKVLILGATGLVGYSLWRDWSGRSGWEVFGTRHARAISGMRPLEVTDHQAVWDVLRSVRPEVIVLAAANPNVDYCELHPEQARKINVESTLRIAEMARDLGGVLVYFSSDYVFDGSAAPYVERDPVCPLNEYGRQKVGAERGIAAVGSEHLILRISGVFGWEIVRKNFVLQILDRAAQGLPTRAAADMRYHPTYAPNLAAVLDRLLTTRARGIFHAVGGQELSRYDLAVEVAKTFRLDPAMIKSTRVTDLPAQQQQARRPLHSSLRSERLDAEALGMLWGAPQGLDHMWRTQAQWRGHMQGLDLPRVR